MSRVAGFKVRALRAYNAFRRRKVRYDACETKRFMSHLEQAAQSTDDGNEKEHTNGRGYKAKRR